MPGKMPGKQTAMGPAQEASEKSQKTKEPSQDAAEEIKSKIKSKAREQRIEAAVQEVAERSKSFLFAVVLAVGITLGLVSFTGLVLRALQHHRFSEPTRYSMSGADHWILSVFPDQPGYFIDIGAFGGQQWHGSSNTRRLEDFGWEGVCVDPVPVGFEERECGTVPRPVAARTGDYVRPSTCLDPNTTSAATAEENFLPLCKESQTNALGIAYLLDLVEAPKEIQYISLAARKGVLPILENFPWSKHCVRAWTVEHDNTDHQVTTIQQIFAHNGQDCSVAEDGFTVFAMCDCSTDSSAAPPAPSPAMQTFARAARRLPGMASHGA
eukprot:TRINITY_DN83004_c0_g1_i1.p1 TRINITY_DN83004_c0_g1~~TRINITY_DN83004_c0_g1_i1.p1  ORF type:complete len:325 (-),score=76.78 TRINITY_DN83004_c0_g1_i1:131-1105(-)